MEPVLFSKSTRFKPRNLSSRPALDQMNRLMNGARSAMQSEDYQTAFNLYATLLRNLGKMQAKLSYGQLARFQAALSGYAEASKLRSSQEARPGPAQASSSTIQASPASRLEEKAPRIPGSPANSKNERPEVFLQGMTMPGNTLPSITANTPIVVHLSRLLPFIKSVNRPVPELNPIVERYDLPMWWRAFEALKQWLPLLLSRMYLKRVNQLGSSHPDRRHRYKRTKRGRRQTNKEEVTIEFV